MESESVFKKSEDVLESVSLGKNKIRIAIVEEERGYFSSTPGAFQKLQGDYPELEIFPMLPSDVTEEVVKSIDGVVMPGGLDHFPEDQVFQKDALPQDMCFTGNGSNCLNQREYIYQKINQWVDTYQVPSMGICLGIQYMALHHGGKIAPVKDEYKELPSISLTFKKDSLAYLYMLSDEEQKNAIEKCELPDVDIDRAYVAHNYSVFDDDYEGIVVGAKAQDGTVESISVGDRAIGFQFHFEACYKHDYLNHPRYKNILANFIKASKQYHEAVKGANGNPALIKERIALTKSINQTVIDRIAQCACKAINPNQVNLNPPEDFLGHTDLPDSLYSVTPLASLAIA